jgi:hypothetical protein
MQIRDLEQWPPSVWAPSGSKLMPDISTATITSVQIKGKSLILSVDDRGERYSGYFGVDADKLKRVARTLKGAIGKTVQDAGMIEVLNMG